MTHPDYNSINAVRFSRLKRLAVSPLHYKEHVEKETEALRLGRAVHLAVLEPARYRDEVAVWEGKTRRGKEWDSFQAQNETKTILRAADHEMAMALSKAVNADPLAGVLLRGGKAEHTRTWTDPGTGLTCKARLDYYAEGRVVDLKTTSKIQPRDFARQAAQFYYHAQLAFYSTGLPQPCSAYIIAPTKEKPIDVVTYKLPARALRVGQQLCEKWLALLAECQARDEWPGIGGGEIQELVLPEYALGEEGVQLTQGGEPVEVE